MATEALRTPTFTPEVATNVLIDLLDQARLRHKAMEYAFDNPYEQAVLRIERDRLLYAVLEIRASELQAGRKHFQYEPGVDYKRQDLMEVRLYDGDRTADSGFVDHELSQQKVEIDISYGRFRTSVDDLARARGVDSLEVLRVIGTPDTGYRDREESYPQRLLKELLALKKYKVEHPEKDERLSEVMREIAFKLIRMRKNPYEPSPLRIGMKRGQDGQGELVFLWNQDPSSVLLDGVENFASVPSSPALQYIIEDRPPKHGIEYWRAFAGIITFKYLDGREPTEEDLLEEEKEREEIAQHMDKKEHSEIPNNWDFWIVSDDRGRKRIILNPDTMNRGY